MRRRFTVLVLAVLAVGLLGQARSTPDVNRPLAQGRPQDDLGTRRYMPVGDFVAQQVHLASDVSCVGFWLYSTVDVTGGAMLVAADRCLGRGSTPTTGRVGIPALSATLPGTWGPPGADPRTAVDFDGASSMFGPDAGDQLAQDGQDYTICVWSDRDVAASNDRVMEKPLAAANPTQIGLRITSGNLYSMVIENTLVSSTAEAGTDSYFHFCGTYTDTAPFPVEVFLDAVSRGGPTNVADLVPDGGDINFGAGGFAHTIADFDGQLHSAMWWERLLTLAELCAVCRCGATNQIQDRTALCNACALPAGTRCAY